MFSIQSEKLAPARPEAARSSGGGPRARLTQRTPGLARSGIAFGRALLQLLRERRALLGLDPRTMRDLGISRATAEQEVRRPFFEQLREIRQR